MAERTCSHEGCERTAIKRGMCNMHYMRARVAAGGFTRATPLERFLTRVNKTSDCWLWLGATTAEGYGRFNDAGNVLAHRWAYQHFVGPIPDGLHLDHLCRVRVCVRPDHLEPVTPQTNLLRSHNPKVQTYLTDICGRGHSMEGASTKPNGARWCVTCKRASERRRYALRRAEAQRSAA